MCLFNVVLSCFAIALGMTSKVSQMRECRLRMAYHVRAWFHLAQQPVSDSTQKQILGRKE